jgi:hypothetical protein
MRRYLLAGHLITVKQARTEPMLDFVIETIATPMFSRRKGPVRVRRGAE